MDKIFPPIIAFASLSAAAFWIWASLIKVPDNIDTFISVLQKIGRTNAFAAFSAAIAALALSAQTFKGIFW